MDDAVVLTEVFESLNEFTPLTGSVYVYGTTPEARSAHSDAWEQQASAVDFVRLLSEERTKATFEIAGASVDVLLRSTQSLRDFWGRFSGRVVYLDITGIAHHIWAPLLRAAKDAVAELRVVYVEPVDYSRSDAPTEGEIFDLSEKIGGIAPIPGFASLRAAPGDDFHLVVLLGFEGTRFSYLLENIQPPGGQVTPIVGAPGFKPQYPFYTYQGNKAPLRDTRGWATMRYATANCPFSVFQELESIADGKRVPLKVAPIGTKPHSLGAVLFAIDQQDVEIVYDHPKRGPRRTTGAARALVYRVTPLLARRGSS